MAYSPFSNDEVLYHHRLSWQGGTIVESDIMAILKAVCNRNQILFTCDNRAAGGCFYRRTSAIPYPCTP